MSQESSIQSTPKSGGSNPGQRPSRNGTQGCRGRQKWEKSKQNKGNFTGKTKEMNGHVFQLQVEQRCKGQYQETVDQLQVYASPAYKKEIKKLNGLMKVINLYQSRGQRV